MNEGDKNLDTPQQTLMQYIFKTLASLTSDVESCRKKLIENRKILDDLLLGLKS